MTNAGGFRSPAGLLARPRFELIPMRGVEEQLRFLPPGATVTVTCSPRKGIDATLDTAQMLAAQGFRAAPHVSARLVRDRSHLADVLERVAAIGAVELFVVGGDVAQPVGPYASGLDLLRDAAEIGATLPPVGIPAYPDGHPLIDREALTQALLDKRAFAGHVVTQICFDPARIAHWLDAVRTRGMDLPVYLGVPGVLKRRKLMEISLRVGVGETARYIGHHAGIVARLVRRGAYRPDAFVVGAAAQMGGPDSGVAGIHLNTFNQVQATERWRREVLAAYAWDAETPEEDAAS
ncbi:MAG TPA: methylenetetrahydrofolate reductase [Actinomycetota bacterium]